MNVCWKLHCIVFQTRFENEVMVRRIVPWISSLPPKTSQILNCWESEMESKLKSIAKTRENVHLTRIIEYRGRVDENIGE